MNDLEFKRPGGVLLHVNKSAGGYIYAYVMQVVRGRCQTLAHMTSVPPRDCTIWDIGGRWQLDVRGATFLLRPDEARQLQETFAFEIRRAERLTATTEAQPCL